MINETAATPSPQALPVVQRPDKSWSPARVGAGLVLAAWAGMFWTLLATGRIHLYLSTRTSWVAPVGAVLLTASAVGRLIVARTREPEPLHRRESLVLAGMVLPVILILALPSATLGSFTVSKKAPLAGNAGLARGSLKGTGPITLLGVFEAQNSSTSLQLLTQRAGTPVDFVGFVTRTPDTPPDEFYLNRWVITCCAADTLLIQVRVVNAPIGAFATNQWVDVQGPIYAIGDQVLVIASAATPTARPTEPYLTS